MRNNNEQIELFEPDTFERMTALFRIIRKSLYEVINYTDTNLDQAADRICVELREDIELLQQPELIISDR